jgi:hypothetical protein
MTRTARSVLIVALSIVVVLAILVGSVYWFLWIRPFNGLHARASALVAGTPATLESRADGVEANESISPLNRPVTVVTYWVHASPQRVCAALAANVRDQYAPSAIASSSGLPGVARTLPLVAGEACGATVTWSAGRMDFGASKHAGGVIVAIDAGSDGTTARSKVVLPA